jgi:hypothetical protein
MGHGSSARMPIVISEDESDTSKDFANMDRGSSACMPTVNSTTIMMYQRS